MRVIAGKARRLGLVTPKGMDTRPTTDRIKETLFNMINADIYDCIFLDLFSGSGAIGIEALSRGAKRAVFIENNNNAIDCIKSNLKSTKLEEEAVVINAALPRALKNIEGQAFDIVFMDPPYNLGIENDILSELKELKLIHEDSIIIIEADLKRDFKDTRLLGYKITKEKEYKTNKHIFLKVLTV